ncbi:hypothetical protein CEG14_22195 [Bordetella genomosp. 1]|uniref:Lipoprotein n=1 Tax=Bordetella genomosp. 1 TaxID=1395607 RepID=A0A261RV70_9BORD|nr:hypothetical protein [Bordetella genomosp. 1]OZI28667.1 hypothetical protein CEG14_22195 [Bordetella genomosp. 1]
MSVARPFFLFTFSCIACASVVGCADNPPKRTGMDYQSSPSAATSDRSSETGRTGQRLTIQSGEGEQLNLPWFIQDTQDWINSN